jgi:GIY-YIG catalytic domain
MKKQPVKKKAALADNEPPFEAREIIRALGQFRLLPYGVAADRGNRPVGSFKWGVYAFYDYDGEPIYVGQTKEKLSGRISRHLTNQRTDAVAMAVLDPFEVCEVEVWPLPQFDGYTKKHTPKDQFDEAQRVLNGLERLIFDRCIGNSRFGVILNEKDPPQIEFSEDVPSSVRGRIVPDTVLQLRAHPDARLARRAAIVSRLSQIISERQVQGGLRRVLVVQAQRLMWLAERRYQALGGAAIVPIKKIEEEED